jgi:hypothetical protein
MALVFRDYFAQRGAYPRRYPANGRYVTPVLNRNLGLRRHAPRQEPADAGWANSGRAFFAFANRVKTLMRLGGERSPARRTTGNARDARRRAIGFREGWRVPGGGNFRRARILVLE